MGRTPVYTLVLYVLALYVQGALFGTNIFHVIGFPMVTVLNKTTRFQM